MKKFAAFAVGLGLLVLANLQVKADEQYANLLKEVYAHWSPPPNAQLVKGELAINAAGQLVEYKFYNGIDNETLQSVLAAISQVQLTSYAPDAASSLNGIVRVGVEFNPKSARGATLNMGSAIGPKSKSRKIGDAAQSNNSSTNGDVTPTVTVPGARPAASAPSLSLSDEISAGSPKEVLEATWNARSFINLAIGQLSVVAGPASGNREFSCGAGSIGPGGLAAIKAAQTIGLVWAVEDTPSQQYNQGQSFSWGQMLDQTTAGVQARITVTPTPLGRSLDVTNSLAPSLRLKNCMRIRQGAFRITQVVKEDPQRKGVTDYKVLFVNYRVTWTPQYKQIMQILGQPVAENRKAIALLKNDPFSSKWVLMAGDAADVDKDFTTANVANALAVAK
jgi:hypothetical protein